LDEGIYTVKAAAARAGVTPELLRAWERRYGVPSPARSASGYRLYSEEDIRAVRWIREKTEWGFGVRRAVELFKGDWSDLGGATPLDDVQRSLLERFLAGEWEKAEKDLGRAFLGHGVEEVCLEIVRPLLVRLGVMWRGGEIGVAHEHWVSEALKSALTRLMVEEKKAQRKGVRAIVGCAPEELHEIGALMCALFLARRGLEVLYLGQAVPLEDLRGFVREFGAEAVFLSVSEEIRAKQMLAALPEFEAASDVRVFVGGQAFESEELRRAACEHFVSSDLREAADAAVELLQHENPVG
jgi:MerR family transcriptional regulator, light-induced transcriptional regulator